MFYSWYYFSPSKNCVNHLQIWTCFALSSSSIHGHTQSHMRPTSKSWGQFWVHCQKYRLTFGYCFRIFINFHICENRILIHIDKRLAQTDPNSIIQILMPYNQTSCVDTLTSKIQLQSVFLVTYERTR